MLHYTRLDYTTLHHTILRYNTLYYITLHYTTLYIHTQPYKILTYEGDVEEVILIEDATVVVGHGGAETLEFGTHVLLEVVEGQRERVHRVHHELDFGLLLVTPFGG